MTLRPSRLFYWIPLLLFACAGPSLAAQTWTTVWTPDSAPATKATTKDGTHESDPDKCYPCKEWEEYPDGGGGRWVDLNDVAPAECPTPTSHARRQTSEADPLPDHLNPCKTCTEGEVVSKPDGTPVDAGEGCGCCKDGQPWAPEPDCPDPMEINFEPDRIGDCPCTGCELGCMLPVRIFFGSFTVCYKQCAWKPVPPDPFQIKYYEGGCPNRCDSTINSTNDVNASNYCAVLNKLKERINHAQNSIENPPPPPSPIGYGCSAPRETFCFMNCISRHEAIHVQQLLDEWEKWKSDISDDLGNIEVTFDCDTADGKDDVCFELNKQVSRKLTDIYTRFFNGWDTADMVKEQEKEAYQDTLSCLQHLLAQIEQKRTDNNWPPCANP